jgi:hypothetical protein
MWHNIFGGAVGSLPALSIRCLVYVQYMSYDVIVRQRQEEGRKDVPALSHTSCLLCALGKTSKCLPLF